MGNESLDLVEFTELNLNTENRKVLGKWADTLAMTLPTNILNLAVGYSIVKGLTEPDIGFALVSSFFYFVGGYPQIMEITRASDFRARAIQKITDVTSEAPQMFSEVNKTRIVAGLSGLAGYGIGESLIQGKYLNAALATACFGVLAYQNLSIGMRSDRRREVLRDILKV
jgi:hypothetical protein